ncbi:MAG: VTT domain-containing protein [Pseudomonadota bacterium]
MKTSYVYVFFMIAVTLAFLVLPFLAYGKLIEAQALEFMDADQSRAWIAVFGGAALALDPILPIPSSIIATQLGNTLGFVAAALVNSVAFIVAGLLGYGIGTGGRQTMLMFGRRFPHAFEQFVQRFGLVAVLICRPIPVLSEASLIIAGASRAQFGHLLLWTSGAQAILGLLYASVGAYARDQEGGFSILLVGFVGIPAVGICLLLAIMMKVFQVPQTVSRQPSHPDR